MDPLASLNTAAKTAVKSTVEWAFGDSRRQKYRGAKSDPVLSSVPLDTLRRAAYYSVFDTLFQQAERHPYVLPDKTLKTVIKKLGKWVYPKGTVFKAEKDELDPLLQEILQETDLQKKSTDIVREAALMGYCGLRSVWDAELGRWLLEVKPKEYLVIETREGVPEEIIAIGMEWPIERPGQQQGQTRRYWKKERWTLETYQLWAEQPETAQGKPDFGRFAPILTEPNAYGELPITIVPHFYAAGSHGAAVVNEEEILTVKALIRLNQKRHFGHLKFMDPNPVVKDAITDGVEIGIGEPIYIQSGDGDNQADLTLLEYAGMPESVKDEYYDHLCDLFEAAGLTPPPKEQVAKPGTDVAGVALRLLDKDDAQEIDDLRENGYSLVLRHVEKLLRMGRNINLPDYGQINPEDPDTWTVSAQFPDFFPPTDQDVSIKIANMKLANLPPEIMAPMVAALFGLKDPQVIAQIQQGIEQERSMLEASMQPPGG